jgi:predicted dehydrogenase
MTTLAKKLATIKPGTLLAGVDLGLDSLVVVVLDAHGRRDMVRDDRVQLFDNGGSNDIHAEPCIATAQAGKHVRCEKPLARSAPEAAKMLEAVTKAGVKHAVMFNYRFVPAIRQAGC